MEGKWSMGGYDIGIILVACWPRNTFQIGLVHFALVDEVQRESRTWYTLELASRYM
jgi:hypothetical protein